MRPLTAALLLASLAGAGAAADGADDDREKPPPLAQVMSIPDLTEVCGPCNECMGPEAAKTDPDDAAIIARRPHRRRRRGGGRPPRPRRVPVHAVRLVAEGAAKEARGGEWGGVSAEEPLLR